MASPVANAYMQSITGLPTIHSAQPTKIHDFYAKLASHIQVLETMGKVKEIIGFALVTLDKLPGIRVDLVRLDDNWQEWGFPELIESLRRWCDRNPILMEDRKPDLPNRHAPKRSPVFQAKDESPKKGRTCVYCNSEDHRPLECKKVTDLKARRKIWSDKKLRFNCTGPKHQAKECPSKYTCQHCGGKHHTSNL